MPFIHYSSATTYKDMLVFELQFLEAQSLPMIKTYVKPEEVFRLPSLTSNNLSYSEQRNIQSPPTSHPNYLL